MPFRSINWERTQVGRRSKLVTLCGPLPAGMSRAQDGGLVPEDPKVQTWAEIRALRGQELDKQDAIVQESDHLVNVAYPVGLGLSLAWTVQFEDREFQIKYIEDPDEMHVELNLYCAEIGQNAANQS